MTFSKIYSDSLSKKVVSLEFFPPQKEDLLPSTFSLIKELSIYNPKFMTVTYRVGGGTADRTKEMVSFINNKLDVTAVSHLTCIGNSVEGIDKTLESLKKENISYILALRGDMPKGVKPLKDGFKNARDLVKHISKVGGFSISVAGYPEGHRDAKSVEEEINYLKEKVDSGAEVILTQLFFHEDYYLTFRDRCDKAKINVPIVPGIMPISNVSQLSRFTKMCKANIPEALRESLNLIKDDASKVNEFGVNYAITMSKKLLKEGAPGVHLYTLNKSNQIPKIMTALKDYI